MNTTQTLQQMQQLRLHGMYHSYHSQLELPMDQQLEGHDLVAQLVQSEQLNRSNEKTAYYLKLAKLRLAAMPEQIECSPARNLTKQQLATLIEGRYLQTGRKYPNNRCHRLWQKLSGLCAGLPSLSTGI